MADTSQLVDSIYAAALEPELWPGVLTEIRARLRVVAINLILIDRAPGRPPLILEAGHDPAAVASWQPRASEDPNLRAGLALSGELVWSERVMPQRAYALNPFVNEVMVPGGLYHVLGLVTGGSEATFGVGIHRPRPQPFLFADGERALPLLRHLSRAMRVQRRLATVAGERQSLVGLLDRLRGGAVMVDRQARVVLANAAAQAMASAADGLSLADSVGGATPAATRHLRLCLLRVAVGGASVALTLTRPSGLPSYRVLIVPLGPPAGAEPLAPRGAVALVLITDPQPPLLVEPAVLECHLELSPSEARVTSAMLSGLSSGDIADRLGITVGTLRVHVRSILAKTGAANRAELIARLAAGLPSALIAPEA